MLLQHICKAGNGTIPKIRTYNCVQSSGSGSTSGSSSGGTFKKSKYNKQYKHVPAAQQINEAAENNGINNGPVASSLSWILTEDGSLPDVQGNFSERSAEERLAREFQVLFKDVTEAFTRNGTSPKGSADFETEHIVEVIKEDVKSQVGF